MQHCLTLYGVEQNIIKQAVDATQNVIQALYIGIGAESGEIPALKNRLDYLLVKGASRFLFDSKELRIIYSGLSIMEFQDWPRNAQNEIYRYQRSNNEELLNHPLYGTNVTEKFAKLQDVIRRELAAA